MGLLIWSVCLFWCSRNGFVKPEVQSKAFRERFSLARLKKILDIKYHFIAVIFWPALIVGVEETWKSKQEQMLFILAVMTNQTGLVYFI
jgi:hypothetical protein